MPKSSSHVHFTFKYVNVRDSITLAALLPAICMVAVVLRFYTRLHQRSRVGIDDWLAVAALIGVLGMGICVIIGAAMGLVGTPTPPPPSNLTPAELENYIGPTYETVGKLVYIFEKFMIFAYGLVKLSIVAFYRRIFVVHKNSTFDIATKVSAVVIILWSITYECVYTFDCGRHFFANWTSPAQVNEYCPVGHSEEYGMAASDLILDVVAISLPLPTIWSLQMSTKRKWAVSGVMLLGASAIGASLTRLVLYIELLYADTAHEHVDRNLQETIAMFWNLLEAGLSLIAACLPTLSYLFTRHHLQHYSGSIRKVFSAQRLGLTRERSASAVDSGGLEEGNKAFQ